MLPVPPRSLHFICDQKMRDIMGDSFFGVALGENVPEWVVQSDTIEGLAEVFDIDVEGLTTQVERWNADANAGVDTQFHRGGARVRDPQPLS